MVLWLVNVVCMCLFYIHGDYTVKTQCQRVMYTFRCVFDVVKLQSVLLDKL